ncbi:hypothetical protein [Tabrizicola sp.]|uniref:hypothetical protein n=1 Tax=Tabrizicola sp. TaxID=2005166 RepID=UPI003F3C57D9
MVNLTDPGFCRFFGFRTKRPVEIKPVHADHLTVLKGKVEKVAYLVNDRTGLIAATEGHYLYRVGTGTSPR